MRTRQPYPKDYSTHLPILIALSRVLSIKTVVEYGAGLFSTPLFLNRDVFPDVTTLVTCETAHGWRQTVLTETTAGANQDRLVWYDGDALPDDTYDLVFADSATEEHKANLIRLCSTARQKVVVVHDSEVPTYQEPMRGFKYFKDFQAFEPCTAIVWNAEGLIPEKMVVRIDKLLEMNCDKDPTDVPLWLKIFDTGIPQ